MRYMIGVLFLAVAFPATVAGQFRPTTAEEGLVRPTELVRPTASGCLTAMDWEEGLEIQELDCEVVDSTSITGPQEGRVWMYKYLRRAIWRYEPVVDTLALDELVLVEAHAGREERQIIWRLVSERAISFLGQVESAISEGRVLVSYFECLNGTGGCGQQFLLGEEEWSVVAQPYLDELETLVPEGWRLHKGRRIDIQTMEGVQPIAKPTDGNCCPSGRIDFTVVLREGRLELLGAVVSGDP